ncbi:unnamed protein product [Cylicocyclus nassatus]|uniref:F-box domain-containing protein n=1 Tax=Cylicocyclus nassatus TaxID=53992 RepID=A0AA36H520_CYLNA|nr:unnamed protein product [Cylicocyclus nassatus]
MEIAGSSVPVGMRRDDMCKVMAKSTGFHRWGDLPVDIKLYILKYLAFPTLRRLMFLNKECYNLIRKIKPKVELRLEDAAYSASKNQRKRKPAKNHDSVELHIYWDNPGASPKSEHDYPLIFVKENEEQCCVQRLITKKGKFRKRPGTRYSSNTITAATKVLFWLSKVLDIQATTVSVPSPNADLQAVLAEQSSSQKIAKQYFAMITEDKPSITIEFLRFLKPGCGVSIEQRKKATELFDGSELFNHEIIRCARSIQIFSDKDLMMTDHQLVRLAAEEISINASNITPEAINKLILEWLEGKRKISIIMLDTLQTLDSGIILQNVDPNAIMLWEDYVKLPSFQGKLNFEDAPTPVVRGPQGFLVVRTEKNSCMLVSDSFSAS